MTDDLPFLTGDEPALEIAEGDRLEIACCEFRLECGDRYEDALVRAFKERAMLRLIFPTKRGAATVWPVYLLACGSISHPEFSTLPRRLRLHFITAATPFVVAWDTQDDELKCPTTT